MRNPTAGCWGRGLSAGCVGGVVSLQAALAALVAKAHRFGNRATVGDAGQDQQAGRDQLVTLPPFRVGQPVTMS